MASLVHELIEQSARRFPGRPALGHDGLVLCYQELQDQVSSFAAGLIRQGLWRGDRVAVYAEKRFETVIAMFGASCAGGVFVPLNPLLKSEQVAHILTNCDARVLVTTAQRLRSLETILSRCPEIALIICIEDVPRLEYPPSVKILSWEPFLAGAPAAGAGRITTFASRISASHLPSGEATGSGPGGIGPNIPTTGLPVLPGRPPRPP